jgi:Cyclin, N-terminal domain
VQKPPWEMDFSTIDQLASSRTFGMDDIVETIVAMCRQESTGYSVVDYISHNVDRKLDIDRDCRKKMVSWSYQVIDFCKFNRETVEIAMSYLDRFLCTHTGIHALQDRSVYQLAAMASLYTAVKIHEPEAMDPALVSNLSRGTYSPSEIEEMEFIIIQSLRWRLNPPTTLSFIREFIKMTSIEALDEPTRIMVYELCKFQAEFATSNHDFVEVHASEKAYHSFINALECLNVDSKVIQYIANMIQHAIGTFAGPNKHLCGNYIQVQSYLYSALVQHPKIRAITEAIASPIKYIDDSHQTRQRSAVSISPRSSIVNVEL